MMRASFPVITLVCLVLGAVSLADAQDSVISADVVKREFLHSWNAYKEHAWGHDELRPISAKPHDWYSASLLMTPVDAFDTMILMGLHREAEEAKQLILDSLSFDRDIEVQAFEITIRHLGGLLAAYQLDGDPRFLRLAEDLGRRLLPVFNTPTGMPRRYVNLRTGATRDSANNPAEIGTSLLEFGTLSKLTGDPVYYGKSKRALVALYSRRSTIGLVGTLINVETGEWIDRTSHIGGMIDSYYEYLLKSWLLFGDTECRTMWEESIRAVNTWLADTSSGKLWYGQADMESGKRTGTTFGSLEAFFPAVLSLSGDRIRAARLEESCLAMWNLHGIEPEEINYLTMTPTARQYVLRPEIIESAWYLYHFTGDQRYRRMGETFARGLMRYCRVKAGYAQLRDVTTKERSDGMQSFFFAETLKYLYLLFARPGPVGLDTAVFTTEAHPLRNTWAR